MPEIRLATPEDAEELHKIFTHAAEFKQTFNDQSWREGFSYEGVSWILDQCTTYVAIDEDVIVGTTALEWVDDGWGDLDNNDAGYIRRLAVAKDWHGKGVATAILDWALHEVKTKNRQFLRLDCAQENESLCNYYENHGFELIETVSWPSDTGKETAANLYQKTI